MRPGEKSRFSSQPTEHAADGMVMESTPLMVARKTSTVLSPLE
jgi:hypothetical protein